MNGLMNHNLAEIEVTMIAMSTTIVAIVTLSVLPTNTSVTLLLQRRGKFMAAQDAARRESGKLGSAVGRMIPAIRAEGNEAIAPLSACYADALK